MNTTAIRQQLHQYIEDADDNKIEAIFTILQTDMKASSSYTDEELKKFYDRREKYQQGNTTTYNAEEAHEYIRNSRNKA